MTGAEKHIALPLARAGWLMFNVNVERPAQAELV
jgi:hypothetical protein